MSKTKRQQTKTIQQQRHPLTPETKEAILNAMARKALQGNTAAAKILLDEYRATETNAQPVTIIIDV